MKKKGKRIITLFVGDDVRWEPAMKQEYKSCGMPIYEYENYDYSINSLNKRLLFLRTAEKYSDIILSQPNNSQLSLRPYHNLNIPIIAKKYILKSEQRKIP